MSPHSQSIQTPDGYLIQLSIRHELPQIDKCVPTEGDLDTYSHRHVRFRSATFPLSLEVTPLFPAYFFHHLMIFASSRVPKPSILESLIEHPNLAFIPDTSCIIHSLDLQLSMIASIHAYAWWNLSMLDFLTPGFLKPLPRKYLRF
jgi:hypothetical protein